MPKTWKNSWVVMLAVLALVISVNAQSTTKKKKNHKSGTAAAATTTPATTKTSSPSSQATAAPAAANSDKLEAVLSQMDKAAASFHSAEADFVWDQFQAIVQEHDLQKGKVFFVRHEKDTHMAAQINEPDKKQVIFTDGKIRFYQPKIDQVTEYEAGANKEEVESFMVLGFGGRGHDLLKSFDVKYAGEETIDGVKTVKLELVPKAEKVKKMFSRFILWIDPVRDVSLRQEAFEPSGDFRTATYSNIKLNEKVPEDTFKLKTTSKTKVVRPQ
ncbi:MAG TPA: outer-membrane lipoprotein carrier protein LolA [Terriglobales bacterium]|nr:outer-membrane lipoprotein carrier protein LolA [Terriglobales bacterium]